MDDDAYPPAEPSPRRILSRSARKEEILDCSLMLASQGVKHWTEFDGEEYILSLDESDFALAARLVEIYRAENQGFQDEAPDYRSLDLLIAPLLYLAVPASLYFWVEPRPWANWWHERGSADAAAILGGEWWRCLTATTLHADHEHLLGNLLSGYFVFNLLNHRLGIGTLMIATLVGSTLTNLLVAAASGEGHVSIGFSTVVFCAMGLLAALETLQLRRKPWKGLRQLAPLIAAFFLAVFVGLGEHVDVKAHFYGFGAGAALGLLTRFLPKRWERPVLRGTPPWQAALVLAAYGAYALAWRLALR
jgi:rhomboid protease GluP